MYFTLLEAHGTYRVRIDKKNWPRIQQHNWHVRREDNGYLLVYTTINRKPVILSRFILGVTDSNIQIDHIDNDTLNNREFNLRQATSQQNSFNRSKMPNCTSEYKGVSWYKNASKWHVEIRCNKVTYRLGYFVDEVEAAKAYNEKAKELFGEFAKLNAV